MEERFIHVEMVILAHQQPAEVTEPRERPFDFPAVAVPPQRPAIVERRFPAILAMRTDQQHPALQQSPAQRIAVVTPVGDDPQGSLLRSPRPSTRHRDPRQGAFGQGHFRRTGRDQLASQRNTLAVDHHHPLRPFAAFGLADAEAPFFAGAKLPSKKLSLQSRVPRWSSSARKARQILSHNPCCSHWRNRRQQVLALGYSLGKSRQRAPVLSTQRMPSTTCRWSRQGRPRDLVFGSNGSIRSHCASVRNGFGIPSFSHNPRKGAREKYLHQKTYETASR